MDIPGINKKAVAETPASEDSQSSETTPTSPGIAAEGDALENAAEGVAYFYTNNGQATTGDRDFSFFQEEDGSLEVGAVDQTHSQRGGIFRLGYKHENVNLAGKVLNVDFNVTGSALVDASEGYAFEVSLGKDTHLQLGADLFLGLLLGLAGSLDFGVGELDLGLSGGFGGGFIANLDIGVQDGLLNLDLRLGAGAGPAGVLDLGISFDLKEFSDLLQHVAAGVGDAAGAEELGEWLSGIGLDESSGPVGEVLTRVSVIPERLRALLEGVLDRE